MDPCFTYLRPSVFLVFARSQIAKLIRKDLRRTDFCLDRRVRVPVHPDVERRFENPVVQINREPRSEG